MSCVGGTLLVLIVVAFVGFVFFLGYAWAETRRW